MSFVDLIKLKQYHLHNFPCCTICEFLICPGMSHPGEGAHNKKCIKIIVAAASGTTRSIIMVFKVSFVININLFARSVVRGQQTSRASPRTSHPHRNLLSSRGVFSPPFFNQFLFPLSVSLSQSQESCSNDILQHRNGSFLMVCCAGWR